MESGVTVNSPGFTGGNGASFEQGGSGGLLVIYGNKIISERRDK